MTTASQNNHRSIARVFMAFLSRSRNGGPTRSGVFRTLLLPVLFIFATKCGLPSPAQVVATVETTSTSGVADADDPCIWIHPTDPSLSTIIGTDKEKGLSVYDLSGQEIHSVRDGGMNNVDIRYNFPLGGKKVAIVTAGNRSTQSIAIYKVNPENRHLENVAARTIEAGIDVYGSCMYQSTKTGKYYFILNSHDGEVEQWEIFDNSGRVDAKQVRTFQVGSQTEGCVADDELGYLYIGEENVAIWKYGAEPETGPVRTQVDAAAPDGHFVADVEGLTIYYAGNGTGYLIASSQGNSTYLVYERQGNNDFVTAFRILAGKEIDGASDTDGIDVTNVSLGPSFPAGVFVVHDGENEGGDETNYKLVPWQRIAQAMSPPLTLDKSWNPRGTRFSGQ